MPSAICDRYIADAQGGIRGPTEGNCGSKADVDRVVEKIALGGDLDVELG